MKTMGIIAAMPEETRPLLKLAGSGVRIGGGRFTTWHLKVGGLEVTIVESGIGIERARGAVEELVGKFSPEMILSFGFGGAVKAGLKVGDLVVGKESWFTDGTEFTLCHVIEPESMEMVAGRLNEVLGRTFPGQIITSLGIVNKSAMARSLPGGMGSPVLDMETAAVAEVANRHGIPFMALRAVSDDAGEELAFSLEEFTDLEMRIRPMKVLATVARKPWIIPQLLRLARNSRTAGRRLARGVMEIIGLADGKKLLGPFRHR